MPKKDIRLRNVSEVPCTFDVHIGKKFCCIFFYTVFRTMWTRSQGNPKAFARPRSSTSAHYEEHLNTRENWKRERKCACGWKRDRSRWRYAFDIPSFVSSDKPCTEQKTLPFFFKDTSLGYTEDNVSRYLLVSFGNLVLPRIFLRSLCTRAI